MADTKPSYDRAPHDRSNRLNKFSSASWSVEQQIEWADDNRWVAQLSVQDRRNNGWIKHERVRLYNIWCPGGAVTSRLVDDQGESLYDQEWIAHAQWGWLECPVWRCGNVIPDFPSYTLKDWMADAELRWPAELADGRGWEQVTAEWSDERTADELQQRAIDERREQKRQLKLAKQAYPVLLRAAIDINLDSSDDDIQVLAYPTPEPEHNGLIDISSGSESDDNEHEQPSDGDESDQDPVVFLAPTLERATPPHSTTATAANLQQQRPPARLRKRTPVDKTKPVPLPTYDSSDGEPDSADDEPEQDELGPRPARRHLDKRPCQGQSASPTPRAFRPARPPAKLPRTQRPKYNYGHEIHLTNHFLPDFQRKAIAGQHWSQDEVPPALARPQKLRYTLSGWQLKRGRGCKFDKDARSFRSYGGEDTSILDLLDKSRAGLELFGRAAPYKGETGEEEGEGDDNGDDSRLDPNDLRTDGVHNVTLKSRDMRSLKLSFLEGVWLESRYSLFKTEGPLHPSSKTGASLAGLLTLFHIASVNQIRGQHLANDIDGAYYIRDAMLELDWTSLGKGYKQRLPVWARISPELARTELATSTQLRRALYQLLPNTPFLIAFVAALVYDRIHRHLYRTSPDFDPQAVLRERKLDAGRWKRLRTAVENWRKQKFEPSVRKIATHAYTRYWRSLPHKTVNPEAEEAVGDGEEPFESWVAIDVMDDEFEAELEVAPGQFEVIKRGTYVVVAGTPLDKDDTSEPWIGRIEYMYKIKAPGALHALFCHISWCAGKRDLPLGPALPDRLLFRQVSGADFVLSSLVVKTVEVVELGPGQPLPPVDEAPDTFYVWGVADAATGSFVDLKEADNSLPSNMDEIMSDQDNGFKHSQPSWCYCCQHKAFTRWKESGPHPTLGGGFNWQGIDYHPHDLVYLKPSSFKLKQRKVKSRLNEAGEELLGAGDDYPAPFALARLSPLAANLPVTKDTFLQVELIFRADDVAREDGEMFRCEREVVVVEGHPVAIKLSDILGRATLEHFDTLAATYNPSNPDWDDQDSRALILARHAADSSPDSFFVRQQLSWKSLPEQARNLIAAQPRLDPRPLAKPDLSLALSNISTTQLKTCAHCATEVGRDRAEKARLRELGSQQVYQAHSSEMYAGCGGLSSSLHNANPFSQLKYHCDKDQAISAAYQHTHPGSQAFSEPLSDLVERATVARQAGRPDPPSPFNVHLLSGGSPCQGFSIVSRYKTQTDQRTLEPLVLLSAILLWQPLSANWENVRPIADFSLPTDLPEKGSLVRTILAGLAAHGYATRSGIMNSAAYGAPQTRRRWFLSCAARGGDRGVPLPPLPERTHCCSDPPHLLAIDMLTEAQRAVNARARARHDQDVELALERGLEPKKFKPPFSHGAQFSDRVHGHAPHRPNGVAAAIGDLQAFEPAYPNLDEHDLPPPPDRADRSRYKPQEVQLHSGFGYSAQERYLYSTPQTTLQRAARIPEPFAHGSVEQLITQGVDDHFCPSLPAPAIAAIAHVGLKSEGQHGNYKDIPPELRLFPPRLQGDNLEGEPDLDRALAKVREGWFLRLVPGERVSPLRTALHYAGDHGARIHPEQNRPLSVRELARCMGMPDTLALGSPSEKSILKSILMVGNAVPQPLGFAIGKANAQALASLVLEDADEADRTGEQRTANFFDELKLELFGDAVREAAALVEQVAAAEVEDEGEMRPVDGGEDRASPAPVVMEVEEEAAARARLRLGRATINGRGRAFKHYRPVLEIETSEDEA